MNLKIIRGDTAKFRVQIEGLTNDLASCYFSVKEKITDSAYTFQKSLNNGITKVSTGIYQIAIVPSDTENIEYGDYYYDLEIGIGTDKYTIMKGKFEVDYDITRGGN